MKIKGLKGSEIHGDKTNCDVSWIFNLTNLAGIVSDAVSVYFCPFNKVLRVRF